MTDPTLKCGPCTACCRNFPGIFLKPADDPMQYDTYEVTNPITGLKSLVLSHKENGDCVYLGEQGCTIYENRPALCKGFDCRTAILRFPKSMHEKLLSGGIREAGKKRLPTLSSEKRRDAIKKRNEFVAASTRKQAP